MESPPLCIKNELDEDAECSTEDSTHTVETDANLHSINVQVDEAEASTEVKRELKEDTDVVEVKPEFVLVKEETHDDVVYADEYTNNDNVEEKLSCDVCGFKAVHVDDLVHHIKTHVSKQLFECTFCDFKTVYKKTLLHHRKFHNWQKPFACSLCCYKTSYKRYLVTHMKSHDKVDQIPLNVNKFKSNIRKKLANILHGPAEEKPVACELCPFRTSAEQYLQRHMKSHQMVFSCKLCSYETSKTKDMNRHKKAHMRGRPKMEMKKFDAHEFKASVKNKLGSILKVREIKAGQETAL